MLNQSKFEHLRTRLRLNEVEEDLARFFWKSAERAMLGESIQEPALQSKDVVQYWKGTEEDSYAFTAAELQYLRVLLSPLVHAYNTAYKETKLTKRFLWDNCDKSDESTRFTYQRYLEACKEGQYIQKQRKKLAEILRKIKRQAKGTT